MAQGGHGQGAREGPLPRFEKAEGVGRGGLVEAPAPRQGRVDEGESAFPCGEAVIEFLSHPPAVPKRDGERKLFGVDGARKTIMSETDLPPGAAPDKPLTPAARRALEEAAARRAAEQATALPTEEGGRDGPEPTRFGDWERKGVAVDF